MHVSEAIQEAIVEATSWNCCVQRMSDVSAASLWHLPPRGIHKNAHLDARQYTTSVGPAGPHVT